MLTVKPHVKLLSESTCSNPVLILNYSMYAIYIWGIPMLRGVSKVSSISV